MHLSLYTVISPSLDYKCLENSDKDLPNSIICKYLINVCRINE